MKMSPEVKEALLKEYGIIFCTQSGKLLIQDEQLFRRKFPYHKRILKKARLLKDKTIIWNYLLNKTRRNPEVNEALKVFIALRKMGVPTHESTNTNT